jgi:hypothetical protein
MKLLTGFLLALLAFVVVGAILALAAQAAWPAGLPADGHRPNATGLLVVDVVVQCFASLAAGICALSPSGLRLRPALYAIGGAIQALTIVTSLGTWTTLPPWYSLAVIGVTFPSFALGAAWRNAIRIAALTLAYGTRLEGSVSRLGRQRMIGRR